MTIASEITRLQGAKADICTAIENKGVTVGNITLDNYASCIDAIQQGGGEGEIFIGGENNACFVDGKSPAPTIKYVAVGGGGGGAGGYRGGGGGGAVCIGYRINPGPLCMSIGAGGLGGLQPQDGSDGCAGYATTIVGGVTVTAPGGYGGTESQGGNSGSGYIGGCWAGGCWRCGRGGGAGAGGNGCDGSGRIGGNGGPGICGFAGGGGAYGSTGGGCGVDGGGNGTCNSCNATNYGGGGGGVYASCLSMHGGNGCQGVVDICYPANGDWSIESASGGDCCFTCNGYCVHRFTSNGTFTIN